MSAPEDPALAADRILAAHGGVATQAAIEAMRVAISAWLAARSPTAPPTDVRPELRDAKRLLMEADDRARAARGNG